jgi:Flp pilus assembly protein TadD
VHGVGCSDGRDAHGRCWQKSRKVARLLPARLGDDDPKAVQLRKDAAAKGKSAFETISSATKSKDNEASPDLQLALADYYRFKQSPALNRYLKAVKDDPRAALIQGMAAAQEDDAGKAVPLLKTAVARSPQSARIHFRLALAYAGLKDDANARAELKETLKLSPQHERAKALMDQLGAPSAAEQK